MARDRDGGRRADRHVFRPTIDGRLEARRLLAADFNFVPGLAATRTARGGRSALVVDADGEQYRINVSNEAIVRAVRTLDGRVDLVVTGSRFDTVLTINRTPHFYKPTQATDFPAGATAADAVLRIRNINVQTGAIRSILGYGTAELSGTVSVVNRRNANGAAGVERIAFYSVRPGGRILVGSRLDTLDVFNNATFDGADRGVRTGTDLNLFNVGGDLQLLNGAAVDVGRDLGATRQPPRGTGARGQGLAVQGNLTLANGGAIRVARDFVAPIVVQGNVIVNGATSVGPVAFAQNVAAPAT